MTSQADYMRPTTELQAVNVMLEAISQAPVASLSAEDTNTDAETALKRLYETSREVQKDGWHCNQEFNYVLDPDADGNVHLPLNTLKVRRVYFAGTGGDDMDLVQRGQRLYDRYGKGFKVGVSVTVDLTVLLEFSDLPEDLRWYITVRGARRFVTGKLASGNAYQFTKADESEAFVRAQQADAETDQRTMKDNPHIMRMRRR